MKVLIGQDQSAPNITGTLQTVIPSVCYLPTANGIGCLQSAHTPTNTMSGLSGLQISTVSSGIKIDASKSSSVYKNTNYLKPHNVSLKTWLRVS